MAIDWDAVARNLEDSSIIAALVPLARYGAVAHKFVDGWGGIRVRVCPYCGVEWGFEPHTKDCPITILESITAEATVQFNVE